MSFEDEKLGRVFPTRTGDAQGSAYERKLLERVNDTQGFRTVVRENLDGSTTMLRTRGGNPEFITTKPTTTEQCELFVDTGIVDLHGAAPMHPNILDAGNIYRTDFTNAQLPEGKGKFAGKLHPPEDLRDKLPDDGAKAKCFSSTDENLATKKETAWKVPSSMFTGRTRLYVQSLYGSINRKILLGIGDSIRPTLTVTTQAREEEGVPKIMIGTGVGLWLDQTDHTHWLIIPDATSVLFLKLRATRCAEKLRKKLGSDRLSEHEKERVETYILSNSVPKLTPDAVQEVGIAETPTDALGYSWHFNWDGTKADLVDVQEIMVRPGAYGFRSTHYRLSFSRTPDGNFHVAREVVSGPTDWSVPKNINVIAYPNWLNNKLLKAGNLPSGIDDVNQSGVIYAFYAKNDLKVVSYSSVTGSYEASRESSPQYFGGLYWSTSSQKLMSPLDGTATTSGNAAGTKVTHTFTCDGISVGGENSNIEHNESTGVFNGRTWGGIVGVGQAVVPGIDLDYGLPSLSVTAWTGDGSPSSVAATWPSTVNIPAPLYYMSRTYRDDYTLSSKYYQKIKGGFSVIVIPFMDAQAVYMTGSQVTHNLGTESTGTRHGPLDTIYGSVAYGHPGNETQYGWFEKYYPVELASLDAALGETPVSTAPYDEMNVVDQGCHLICSHGTFPSSAPGIGSFYSALDEVEQSYGTITSVNGVVIAESTGVKTGTTYFPNYPSLVGWA